MHWPRLLVGLALAGALLEAGDSPSICMSTECRLLSGEPCNRITQACPTCLVALGANDTRCLDALNSATTSAADAVCILGTKCALPASAPQPTPAVVHLRTEPAGNATGTLQSDNPIITAEPTSAPVAALPSSDPLTMGVPTPTPTAAAPPASVKNYVGVTVWATCLIAGIVLARRMYRHTAAAEAMLEAPRPTSDSKDGIAMLDSYRSSILKIHSTRSDPVLTRGRPLDTFRGMSLASLASTNTNMNNGTLLERGSKPAVVNVPFHVFNEESEDDAIVTQRHNETFNSNATFVSNQDSVEGLCFESMRTRISNMTMIEAPHVI
ncbi:hypothetical protein ACHHYP_17110 [Achlya hypogyna]|uniref:Secreted protein n=1 Tax=Achlya hypogyna TaxID=1202772 RepID=A0A1V9Y588_ACHHY|nr:hypothetical protein ACHHYP_17110 [Achlya hypogyna]